MSKIEDLEEALEPLFQRAAHEHAMLERWRRAALDLGFKEVALFDPDPRVRVGQEKLHVFISADPMLLCMETDDETGQSVTDTDLYMILEMESAQILDGFESAGFRHDSYRENDIAQICTEIYNVEGLSQGVSLYRKAGTPQPWPDTAPYALRDCLLSVRESGGYGSDKSPIILSDAQQRQIQRRRMAELPEMRRILRAFGPESAALPCQLST
jgi:hypothetical protein